MKHDDDGPSSEQNAWHALAGRVRDQLAARVPEMGAMNPGELQQFVDTLRDAALLDMDAATLDARRAAVERFAERGWD